MLRLVQAGSSPSILYAGTNASGVFTSTDGGNTWTSVNDGLHASRNVAVALSSDPDILFAAGSAYPGGIAKSTDGGLSWHAASNGLPYAAVGVTVAVDPANPQIAFASAYAFGIFEGYKTINGGATWFANGPGDTVLAFSIDPGNSANILAGGLNNIYRSEDHGLTWVGAEPPVQDVSAVLRDAGMNQRSLVLSLGSLYESLDGGQSYHSFGTGLPGGTALSLAQDPAAPATLYCGQVGGFARSTDGGTSWAPFGDLPPLYIPSVTVDPSNSSTIYVGTQTYYNLPDVFPAQGVLRSTDSGQTWAPFNYGLEDVLVREIPQVVADASGRLFAPTISGVFGYQISDVPPPAPSSVIPDSGPLAGGTPVTILGSGFLPGAQVFFHGVSATDVTVVGPGEITATTGAGSAGAAELRVVNPDAQYGLLEGGFAFDFQDVPPQSPFYQPILTMTLARVTAGCGNGMFCPTPGVTRSEMAALAERTLHGPDFAYPPPGGSLTDVDPCSPAARYIYELVTEGISVGCDTNTFCPDVPLTRAQVAVWLLKAEHGSDYEPPTAQGTVFIDVTADTFAAAWIEQLFAEGFTAGCHAGYYCPDDDVSREESAAFLALAFLQP